MQQRKFLTSQLQVGMKSNFLNPNLNLDSALHLLPLIPPNPRLSFPLVALHLSSFHAPSLSVFESEKLSASKYKQKLSDKYKFNLRVPYSTTYHRVGLEFLQSIKYINLNLQPLLNFSSLFKLLHLQIHHHLPFFEHLLSSLSV